MRLNSAPVNTERPAPALRHHLLLVVLVAFLLPASSSAARPVARYGDPVAPPQRAPLAAQIEQLAVQLAVQGGRTAPVADPRLEAALELLAPRVMDGRAPATETVAEALWMMGVVEPLPYLLVLSFAPGDEEATLGQVRAQLAPLVAEGRYRRVAAYVSMAAPKQLQALVAVQESFVALDPVPRQLRINASAIVSGRVLGNYRQPEIFINPPGRPASAGSAGSGGAQVHEAPVTRQGMRFAGPIRCDTQGRYQIEIVAQGAFGPTVLANFPLFCEVAAPTQLVAAQAPRRETAWRDANDAEAQVRELINHDRAAAGLPPLAADPQLEAVARAHSRDMHDHHFVGHVSPTTGSPSDRVRRAGLPTPRLLLENVAMGSSPGEVEQSLLDSPAHRANLLSPGVDRVGVGAAVNESEGGRELFVTQLFARFPAIQDATEATARLRLRTAELRQSVRLAPLAADPVLDDLAATSAARLAAGTTSLAQAEAPIAAAMDRMGDRYAALRTIAASGIGIEELRLPDSLRDPNLSHAGIATAVGYRNGDRVIFAVIILGTRR
jgi:uncharacterized protein YkwD